MRIYKPKRGAHHPVMRNFLRDEREPWNADDEAADRQTKALAAFALILALALIGCYLVIQLRAVGKIENCLLAQRSNCDSLINR